LRPSITGDETFRGDGTYGPKANFKISLRELPDNGRFRVTVTAAKYNDGLLLDKGTAVQAEKGALIRRNPETPQTLTIPAAGIYQVDIYPNQRSAAPPLVDSSRMSEGLAASW